MNHQKKIGLIFIISILSLAGVSISYAGLTDTIGVIGTVTTAEDFDENLFETSETAWARMNDDPSDFTHEFPGNNWFTYITCTPTENNQTFYLYAGQFHRVGQLNVSNDDNYLNITYDLMNGFTMQESQVHVATTLSEIPQTAGGNPVIGNFDHKNDYDPYLQKHTVQIDWDSDWNDEELFIAAHAVVWGVFE